MQQKGYDEGRLARAEANNGRIYAHNLPEKGCVFSVDLPRIPVPAIAMV